MRKRNLIVAAAVMAIVSLTACGKEGGIIETKSDTTLPTLSTPVEYKETEAQTKPKKEEETWTKSVKGDGFTYSYPSAWEKEKYTNGEEFVWSDDKNDYVEATITKDSLGQFTLDTYVAKFVKDYSDPTLTDPAKKIKVDDDIEDVKIGGYKGKKVTITWVEKDLGDMTTEYTFWTVDDYIYLAYIIYSDDADEDTVELGNKIINTVKIETKKKADL